MYFSDVRGGAIERLEFNGTVPQVVVTTPLQSIGLCIEKFVKYHKATNLCVRRFIYANYASHVPIA